MQTLELFCGTKSFSKVAAARGCRTFTVDNDDQHTPDLCINVLALEAKHLPQRPDMLWASPPCEAFSVAAICHDWRVGAIDRARIPPAMFAEIFSQLPALVHEVA